MFFHHELSLHLALSEDNLLEDIIFQLLHLLLDLVSLQLFALLEEFQGFLNLELAIFKDGQGVSQLFIAVLLHVVESDVERNLNVLVHLLKLIVRQGNWIQVVFFLVQQLFLRFDCLFEKSHYVLRSWPN